MAGSTFYPAIFSLDYRADGSWNPPYVAYALQFAASTLQPGLDVAAQGSQVAVNSSAAIQPGQWAHIAGTYDGSNLIVYTNGLPSVSLAQTGAISYGTSEDLDIGTNSPYRSIQAINGLIDEARISTVARSADWIATEYNNQSSPSSFLSASPSEYAGTPQPLWLAVLPTSMSYARAITIDHRQVANTDQVNFPVLISGTFPYLATVTNGGRVQNANGYDIVFTSDAAGQNQLNHEIDSYNPATGTAAFWVQIPTLSHTADTHLYMWYGNSAVLTSQENRPGVWKGNYSAIWHLGGSHPATGDSSGNGNNGNANGTSAATGMIGGASSFTGANSSYIDFGNGNTLSAINQLAVSAWVNPNSPGAWGGILTKTGKTTAVVPADYMLTYEGGRWGTSINKNDNSWATTASSAVLASQAWTKLDMCWNGTQMLQYTNGVLDTATTYSETLIPNTADVIVGYNFVNSYGWVGSIDEVRVRTNSCPSADWIKTEYNNQTSPTTFASVSSSSVPLISGITPSAGAIGTSVSITGTGFGAALNASTVAFNGFVAAPTSWSDTQIVIPVPSGATTGNVVVTANGAAGNGVSFTVLAPPSVSTISPRAGPVGTAVTITGTSFGTTQGTSTVSFNGTSATPASWSDGQIVVSVPTGATTGSVVVTVSGLASTGVNFTVLAPPSISSISPTSGVVGAIVTITGANFGAAQGTSTVSFNGTPAIPTSWNDTNIVVPVPIGASTGAISVVVAGQTVTSATFSVSAALLTYSVDNLPKSVVLSDPQNADWIIWGASGLPTATRRAGADLISDYTPIGTSSNDITAISDGTTSFTWSGGIPIASSSGMTSSITAYGANQGFQISVPADTTMKTLKLYASVCAPSQLNLSISDNSSPAIIATTAANPGCDEVYSIDFQANSPGQTLTVQILSGSEAASVALAAAILQPHLPQVSITWPSENASYTVGPTIPVVIQAQQYDSNLSSVVVSVNGVAALTLATPPYSGNWSPNAPGHYTFQAQAIDSAGLVGTSDPVDVDIIGSGGTLSVSSGSTLLPIDLTAEGTADWIAFGLTGYQCEQGSRKASVVPLISALSSLKTSDIGVWFDSNGPYSFEDGSPDLQESNIVPNAIVGGNTPGEGLQFIVQADTTPRTLRVYAGFDGGNAQLRAYLSDGSAPTVTYSLQSNDATQTYYYLTYSAASAGQTLNVQLTIIDGGAITMHAATLSGVPLPAQPNITSFLPSSGIAGDPVVIQGMNFGTAQGVVTFNGATAIVSSWSSTQIAAFVPVGASSGPIQVVNAGGVANSLLDFIVGPNLQSVSPLSGLVNAPVTLEGAGFGEQQGTTGQVLFNGVPAIPRYWSDTKIGVSVPVGATTGAVTVVQNGAISSPVPFAVLGSDSGTLLPVLKLRVVDTPASVNLSDPVNTDWIIWGSSGGAAALTRMAGSNLISDVNSTSTDLDVTPLNTSSFVAASYQAQFNSTGGTIYPSNADDQANVTIIVPASNEVQTLKLYVAFVSYDQVSAAIGDGSSPQVSTTSTDPGYLGPRERTYLIDFRAASIPQTVAISLTQVPSGFAWVEAAALQPHVPEVSILSPKDGDVFGTSAQIPLGFDSLQLDSSIATVQVIGNQQQIFQFSDQPYSAQWQASPGHYQIQALATDANGLAGSSQPVQIDVIGSGGALLVSSVAVGVEQQYPIDLTNEGTADWRIFTTVTLNGQTQMAGPEKGVIAPLISPATQIGDGVVIGFSGTYDPSVPTAGGCALVPSVLFPMNPLVLQFEDAAGSTPAGIVDGCELVSQGPDSGLQFSAVADTTLRTMHVYVQLANGQGKLKAFLSDGSAPVVIDRSTRLITDDYYHTLIYTIQYRAQSANQTITVQWTVDDDSNVSVPNAPWEEAILIAADVSGTAQYSGPTITSVTPSSGNSGQTVSINGSGFGSTQGSNTISFGGVNASVVNWTSAEIDAVIPDGTCEGSITVTANGLTSNTFAFVIPLQMQITPGSTGMVVGQSLQLSAMNAACETPLSGVSWTLSPSGLATLTPDNQPILTAVSDGSVTLTATASGVSSTATIQIASLGSPAPTTGSPSGGTTNANSVTLTDSLGHTTTYNSAMFGGSRQITSSTGPGCSACDIRGNNQFAYDSQGNLASATDAMGNTVYYSYDLSGNVVATSAVVSSSTTATTRYTYNSFNEVLTVTDPLGNITSNSYDPSGNLLSIVSPAPGSGAAPSTTQFSYDTKGELTQITDPLGNKSKIVYTSVGLIQSITDPKGNSTSYNYDAHGNRTAILDAAGNRTTFSYDTGDRLIGIAYADGTTSSFTYDSRGRRTSVTDQNGMTTSYSYDDADRLVSVTDPSQHTTTYSYDTESNVLSITDAKGNATSFNHDDYGRVIQTTFPSGMAEYYTYDLVGDLLSKTDRKGQTIQYVYDALKRLTSKQYPGGTSAEYTYDLVGRILNVTDPTGSYGFAYDNMGRMLSSTTQYSFLPGQTLTNSYTYDAASNRTGLTAPDGSTNSYIYDSENRLTTLNNSWAGQFGFSNDALGRRSQMARPNGVNTTYRYDSLSRLLGVLHGEGSDGATYGYDSAGNRTSKQNLSTGTTENYSYDAIYELTKVMQGAGTTGTYSYDPVGNRLASLGVSPYQYDASNHLTAVPTATYSYDYNGNLLSKTNSTGTTQYSWDYENRLVSAAIPQADGSTSTVSFKYDPFGRRIQKSSPSRTRYYVYDGADVVAELNFSGAVVASYLHGLGVDEHLAMRRGGAVAYYQADALGSITSLSTGDTYTYDSFGNMTSSTGSIISPYRFTGREWDSETGLYYYRARYYDPTIGRFISEDPIGFTGIGNFYAYVRNNPINLTDPMGLCPYDDAKKAQCLQKAWGANSASLLIDLTGLFVGGSEEAKLLQQVAFSLVNGALSVATNDSANHRGAFGATLGITGILTNLSTYAVKNLTAKELGSLGLSLIPGVNWAVTAGSIAWDLWSGYKDYEDCLAQ
jgi:RHS repeat-associated protein